VDLDAVVELVRAALPEDSPSTASS
jgi:hypothetical protein